jgi:ribosomal protein S18 acetylase RimI-like enzyme
MAEHENRRLIVREFRDDDVQAVRRIILASLAWLGQREGWNDAQLASIQSSFDSAEELAQLRARQTWLVAVEEGVVVGFLSSQGGDLCQLHVDPTHHRQGIGSALFTAAERTARDAGEAELSVRAAPTSVPFYEAMGMHVGGEVPWRDPFFAGQELKLLSKRLEE